MKTKEIKICGKKVKVAYCFATEISYKILSEEELNDFAKEVIEAINEKTMPDGRKSIFLILAATQAYYDEQKEQVPITDKDLMYHASPEDLGNAIGVILGLRAEFYHLPKSEQKESTAGEDSEKNL